MAGNNVRIVIVGILVTVLLLFRCPALLHSDAPYIALIHHFFHANIFHLAVNCLSVWALFRPEVRYSVSPIVWAYIIASASWFFTSADAVGFSNIIFALAGQRTPSLKNAWWRQPTIILFLAITALMAFLPQVSAVTHIISFALGCIVAGARRLIHSINRDFRRASYN